MEPSHFIELSTLPDLFPGPNRGWHTGNACSTLRPTHSLHQNWETSQSLGLTKPMTLENQPSRTNEKQSKNARKGKKPYQKPAFRSERVFETLALACGKIGATTPQCQFSRKSS